MRSVSETQAEREIVRFLASQPSPGAIVDFHPSTEISDRFYELVDVGRARPLSDDEQRELDTYLYLNHLLKMLKIEARRHMAQQATQQS